MALFDDVTALVETQCPGWGPAKKGEVVSTIIHAGLCYLDANDELCVKACDSVTLAGMLQNGHSLTTHVSADALATLELLRELRDRGVLAPSVFRDLGTVEAEAEEEE